MRSRAILGLGAVAVGLIVSPLVVPAFASVPQQVKVGVVDFEKTMAETPAGKRAAAAFDTIRKAKQDELDKRKKDFLAANQAFQQQQSVMTPDAAQKKREELANAYAELGRLAAQLEHDLAAENQKVVIDLMKQADPLIKELARTEGCTLIVDARDLVWVDPSLDLTARLNAQMK
jgi:Skp family chaperone for outer membrane proteins